MTIEHLLDIIDQLPKEVNYDYIIPGKNKAVLISVDHDDLNVSMEKRNDDGTKKSAGMTTEVLRTIVRNTFEKVPFSVDSIFNGSGSARSTWEAILANTSEYYTCKVHNQKHLIWLPETPHKLGEVTKYEGEFQERPQTSETHVLEKEIADYITQFDKEKYTIKELAKKLKAAIDESSVDSKTFAIHNFGIRFAPHIENGAELARQAWGSDANSATITDGKKIGLNLRSYLMKETNSFSKVTLSPEDRKKAFEKYLWTIKDNEPVINHYLNDIEKDIVTDAVIQATNASCDSIYQVTDSNMANEIRSLVMADPRNRDSSEKNYSGYPGTACTHYVNFIRQFANGLEKLQIDTKTIKLYSPFLTALRTKPFLLLAGISGTGKSQKVQELAFMTCPEGELRDPKSTTPGNYQLVEVKPNWHDSTELLGYYSALSGKYELTDFIRFTYKALQNKDVPFFLCLDEMNLAPVEQYFAEFLSVLETRKKVGDHIETEPLLTKDKFSNCELKKKVFVQRDGYLSDGDDYEEEPLYSMNDAEIINYLKNNGLQLPDNLFVIGTVNMDDTTHQFSRKVIDRAFTIEMNGGKMADMFESACKTLLEYRENPVSIEAFKSRFVRAYEVLDDSQFSKYAETIKKIIPALLGDSDGTSKENNPESINGILNDTPFRVSYRVQNELVLYLSVLIENAGFPDDIDSLISEAVLAILLEKVLPRVQGEKKQLETNGGKSNILKDMKFFVEKHFKPIVEEGEEIANDSLYMKVIKKLEEMDSKLSGYYTNFF